MPDFLDGETIEVWGSGSKPYLLKNVRGVYSCSCPAWRNQSLPIDRRTCKHLRSHLGEEAEHARLGIDQNERPSAVNPVVTAPGLLLAETWTENIDPAGYFMSEKLDRVRAYWNGMNLRSRNGNPFAAPDWFTKYFPPTPLDGELWIGRKQFQRTVSIVRRSDAGNDWNDVRFMVFDAPALTHPFAERIKAVDKLLCSHRPPYAHLLPQAICRSREHLSAELARIEALDGEGLMLRLPGSIYVPRRSTTLLKVKSFLDCEAIVVGHEPGKGRHKGRLGALLVELANGVRCSVGTGLSDAQREQPPITGSVITLKYQELTDSGVPRFPVFGGIRLDAPQTQALPQKGKPFMSTNLTHDDRKRRFEFVQGTSNKFWELCIQGRKVCVTFGRIGTAGQTNNKEFPDETAAHKHAEKMIREKTIKGYVEAA